MSEGPDEPVALSIAAFRDAEVMAFLSSEAGPTGPSKTGDSQANLFAMPAVARRPRVTKRPFVRREPGRAERLSIVADSGHQFIRW
jgi:hypothetical protein